MKHLFNEMDSEELFYTVSPCDVDHARSIIIDVCDTGDWDVDRYKSQKLRYYNLYKYEKSPEEYLSFNISKYQRSLFAQFRCGILPLEIEVGRYRNIPLENRLCRACNDDIVEDEIHFLCQCTKYAENRNNLYAQAAHLDPYFYSLDDIDKFVFLMSNCQKSVSKFLINSVTKRSKSLTIHNLSQ